MAGNSKTREGNRKGDQSEYICMYFGLLDYTCVCFSVECAVSNVVCTSLCKTLETVGTVKITSATKATFLYISATKRYLLFT